MGHGTSKQLTTTPRYSKLGLKLLHEMYSYSKSNMYHKECNKWSMSTKSCVLKYLIDRQQRSCDGISYKKNHSWIILVYITITSQVSSSTFPTTNKKNHQEWSVMRRNTIWQQEIIYLRISNTLSIIYTWYYSKKYPKFMNRGGLARSIYRHGQSPQVCANDHNTLW